MPEPISPQQTHFSTGDPGEARDFLAALYGGRLRVARPPAETWRVSHDYVDAGVMAWSAIDIPSDLQFRIDGQDDLVITTMLGGSAEFDRGHGIERYGLGDVYVAIAPHADSICRTHDVRARMAVLPAALLTEVANGDPRRSHAWPSLAHRPPAGAVKRWRQTSRLVDTLLADPQAAAAPLVVGAAARMLAATALTAFSDHAADESSTAESRDAHPDTLRRAIAFIDANPELDLTLADIARSAYVTPRAIQLAFRRHLETTPLTYLRQVRLQHAHQQLQDADPDDGTTVTRVAADWGFASPSRFAAYYRAAYARSPSDTLNR